VELDIPADLPAVRIDANFADHILTNLLENAVRYAHGRPIRISAAPAGDRDVVLVVEDGGTGVPAAALPRLFERFYRVPRRSGTRDNGGSGIGLAVVRGLAEAMGGFADARLSEMGGLAVVVRLPAEKIEPEAEAPAAVAPASTPAAPTPAAPPPGVPQDRDR
jgi:signal transduction histidine kinase